MSRPCRVGVQLPEVERPVGWPELFSMARTAEAAALDSLWLGDHLLYDLPGGITRGPWEVWTSLAAIAAVTSRIEIGPLVASTGFHTPAMLAKQAATVDAISGGRLVLGLGAGWNEREYRAFGHPFDRRVSRFEEAFTVIRTLLHDGRVDFHGRFYDVDDCVLDPMPVRPGGPPLMLGSVGPRMLGIGLPHVDAWNVWWSDYGNSAAGFGELRERVEEAAAAAGREPGEVAATAAVLVQLPDGGGRLMGETYNRPVAPVVGTPQAIAEHVHAMAEAGASHVQLVLDPITEQSIEVVGEAVALLDA
ncbi:LLM class flavin-dependent oxidoreductase [Phycicoccus sp. SLBN-51]|uniref:TIGR03619 family F420-dependent LLM class oxidoreductase n=1 Tax=Phycicoccus sp. SLBN-51 TaxID=2768447 RepID=UPI00114EE01C|nr:LLM class flavin-dependent oxidoreductase [Phycicoccus sp. SLBN-51]TQJ49108.1 putative F420-dependent oxidoreductase [Phycicoccus sp. SLBN-51]